MPNDVDPIFFTIAQNLVQSTSIPNELEHCKKALTRYFARCLGYNCHGASIHLSLEEVPRATIHVFLRNYGKPECQEELVDMLESVGVETDIVPGSLASEVDLNRFTGINVNETA